MFRNIVFAAVLAALCAGLVTSVIQHFRLTPMIFAAEAFEGAVPEHEHEQTATTAGATAVPAHAHGDEEWMPQDGLERTAYTVLANVLIAAGYGLVICAVALVVGLPLTWSTGLLWGVGGFAAFSLAPAVGLAPGLPGMPVADTLARQLWWAGTALCTGGGLLLMAKVKAGWSIAAAAVLIAIPHLVGAPQPPPEPTGVPAQLAANFSSAVLFNAAVFWAVLGLALGRFSDRFAGRPA